MSKGWKELSGPWTFSMGELHIPEIILPPEAPILTAKPEQLATLGIWMALPDDLVSARLAELLYMQERCFERSILAIAQYHGMRIR